MSKTNKIGAGIIGSAGYTGGELIRLLLKHPYVDIVFANSKSNAGKRLHSVHQDLIGDTDLKFSSDLNSDGIDVLFLCVGHGEAKKFLDENKIDSKVKIIDLSQDFRLTPTAIFVSSSSVRTTQRARIKFYSLAGRFYTWNFYQLPNYL